MLRAHGIRGEVVVYLSTNRTERVQTASALYALNDAGGPGNVLTVSRSRFSGDQWPGTRWIVKFKGIDTRDEALQLRGVLLAAPPASDQADNPDALWVDRLVGRMVVDLHGDEVGRVSALIVNPGGDLLELSDGRLIPLAFVISHDEVRVVVDVPEGLL